MENCDSNAHHHPYGDWHELGRGELYVILVMSYELQATSERATSDELQVTSGRATSDELLLSIHQQTYQGTDADDGEGTYLLEIKGKEGYDADDEAFPIDEVFGGGKGEGCGADEP